MGYPMRSNRLFATGGYMLILAAILLVDIVLGEMPKNPFSVLSVDRSRLKGRVKSVSIFVRHTNQATGKMYDPMECGTYEFTEDGKLKTEDKSELPSNIKIELKESGDITIASHYKSEILTSEERHVFDLDGNIIESTPLYSNTGDYRKIVYTHDFDSHGNWIIRKWVKKGVDSSNQSSINPIVVEVRLITYY
jgi:hypothetical protein